MIAPDESQPPAPPALDLPPGLNVGEAFARILHHHGAVMVYQAGRIRAGSEDPEPVHQTRVALRRLRSALAVFQPAIATPAVTALGQDLRTLGHRLGPARGWDVFLAETGPRLAAAFPDDAAIAALLGQASRKRDAAYAALSRDLAGPHFAALTTHLGAVTDGVGWRDDLGAEQRQRRNAPLHVFGAEMLGRLHRRVRRAGKGIMQLDAPALHVLRLRGKRLRYASEFFAAQFAPKPTRRYLRRLAALQARLGLVNDAATSASLMRELRARGHAGGVVLGYTAAEAAAARPELLRIWKRFRQAEPFWVAPEMGADADPP